MDVRDEILPARTVHYVKTLGPYPEKAPLAWKGLWSWVFEKGLASKARTMVGYGLDNPRMTPAHMLRYFACLELDDTVPADSEAGVDIMEVQGGRYAIYCMKGPYTEMPNFFRRLHDEEMPKLGYVVDYCRPFLEIYLNSPDEVGIENALTDLCIPIREDVASPSQD